MRGQVTEFTHGDDTFKVGSRVRLKRWLNLTGTITKITIPLKGGGVTHVAIDPDDLELAFRKGGASWPLQVKNAPPNGPGGLGHYYLECRDAGLPAWKWERID